MFVVWLVAAALAATPKASSEAKNAEGTHGASLAFDGRLTTWWGEGKPGDGDGEWVEVKLDKPTEIASVSLWPGNLEKGIRSVREYGRPHTVTIQLLGPKGEVVTEAEGRVLDPSTEGIRRVDVPIEGTASAVRVVLKQTYGGGLYADTAIAEVAVNFAAGDSGTAVAKIRDWLGSDAGKTALEADAREIAKQVEKIQAAQFGDSDAFEVITERAADGAPAVRNKVTQSVPQGFRIQAIPPDQVAVDALLALRDANAIPAFQMAATRVLGKAAKKLEDQAEIFSAYQDLVGGGRRNLEPYGESGWEKGAMRSFGEPIAIVADHFGALYIADIGNHRVERFTFSGIADAEWGGDKADLSEAWFDGTRKWYVSGQKGADQDGFLVNPLSLALQAGKNDDVVYVLDAKGRIHKVGPKGSPLERVAQVQGDGGPSAGVGGEAHLVLVGNQLVVIWGNEGFVVGLDGSDKGHFEIKDGAPNGAVALPNNHVGLVFGKELVDYSLDGFRFGDVIGKTLPEGFETFAVAYDEKGKLWAVTDNGWAVKYKKPGVVDYKVKFTELSLDVPRVAPYDDILFVTSAADRILKVDALELKTKFEAENGGGKKKKKGK